MTPAEKEVWAEKAMELMDNGVATKEAWRRAHPANQGKPARVKRTECFVCRDKIRSNQMAIRMANQGWCHLKCVKPRRGKHGKLLEYPKAWGV